MLISTRPIPGGSVSLAVAIESRTNVTSAYKGALQDCASGMNFKTGPWCTRSVVFQDQFHPILPLPISLQWLDPAWATCKPMMSLRDPPIALSVVSMILTRPGPSPAASTAAQPSSALDPVPTQTKVSDPSKGEGQAGVGGSENPPHGSDAAGGNHAPTPTGPAITIGPTVLPIDPSGGGVIIQPGTTVKDGGSPGIVSGTTISLGDGSVIVKSPSGETTIPIGGTNYPPHVTVGGREFTLDGSGNLVAAPKTLDKDHPGITVDGSIVSMGASELFVRNTDTGEVRSVHLEILPVSRVITAGDQIFTMDASGGLILHPGKTLHVGDPAATVSGTVYSVRSSGIVAVGLRESTSYISAIETRVGGEDLSGTVTAGISTQAGRASPTSKKGGASKSGVQRWWIVTGLLLALGTLFS
ncbi:hypothetical protein BCR34DRAFT_353929 [Clohesyomyces aquaticus]|uniref:Uncharacterized protein n=1 Tax=Clohesyomyces aquaticus TaxID=1231657 RepID=A0A1Y1ZJ24_9PLEO|nr:hypothetical protein BCR34DRAFT_353929 [Clohesyomyces aquaticus]